MAAFAKDQGWDGCIPIGLMYKKARPLCEGNFAL